MHLIGKKCLSWCDSGHSVGHEDEKVDLIRPNLHRMVLLYMKKTLTLLMAALLFATVFSPALMAQTRIRFRKGASSTSIDGVLGCNDPQYFVIGARRGQVMQLVLWSKGATASVFDRDGEGARLGADQSLAYRFQYAGDVRIRLYKECGGGTDYRLKVRID